MKSVKPSENKIGKNKVKIVLEKAGCEPISVICPRKIKTNAILTWLGLRFSGFPQFNVTPVDWKGFWIYLFAFISIFVFAAFSSVIGTIGIILGLIDLVINIIMTSRYYYSFITKKLKDGYEIRDAEQKSLCEAAGIFKKLK